MNVVRAYGKYGSSVDLRFDWRRVKPDGSTEPVAYSTMATTWVEIVGHGAVEVRPFPDYMKSLIDSLLSEPAASADSPHSADQRLWQAQQMQPNIATGRGELIYLAPRAPRVEPELTRTSFDTTSNESNVVGNIYYANYYHWQATVIDRFLRGMGRPGARQPGPGGALSCTNSTVLHLREAMPFDSIEVVLALRGLYRCGVDFHFDYYKVGEGGKRTKLAVGEYEGSWIDAATKTVGDLPDEYLRALDEVLSQAAE
jgi:acyl-CoA thioesterase FadM